MLSISVIFVSGDTILGWHDMMSATVSLKKLSCEVSMARRMSPSVMMPRTMPSSSATQRPRRPLLMWITASPSFIVGGITGRSSVRITSRAFVRRRLPSEPPGWNCAKSEALKLRASMRAQARASPKARAAVVDDVGASPSGQAS